MLFLIKIRVAIQRIPSALVLDRPRAASEPYDVWRR